MAEDKTQVKRIKQPDRREAKLDKTQDITDYQNKRTELLNMENLTQEDRTVLRGKRAKLTLIKPVNRRKQSNIAQHLKLGSHRETHSIMIQNTRVIKAIIRK